MVQHKIKRIKITGDVIELVYCYYTGEMTSRPVFDPITQQTITSEQFDVSVISDEMTIVFTRQNAYDMAIQMGRNDVANEIKSITMEQVGKTYNDLLDAYIMSVYEPV